MPPSDAGRPLPSHILAHLSSHLSIPHTLLVGCVMSRVYVSCPMTEGVRHHWDARYDAEIHHRDAVPDIFVEAGHAIPKFRATDVSV